MNMIDRLKTPPMVIGLFLAGLLLFAVVGIARKATGATGATAMQSNVGAAVAAQVSRRATIPAIGDVEVDNFGYRFVWLGRVWLSCRHLDPVSLVYDTANFDPAATDWSRLATDKKRFYAEVCYAE